jgi:dCMP deaminase
VVRPTWDVTWLAVAETIAKRATCPRASVGAVIVRDNHLISAGYNGAPSGQEHCTDIGCLIEDGHCQRAIHAEVNAIADAARRGVSIDGSTIYLYDTLGRQPCRECAKVIAAVGLEVYGV